MAISSLTRRWDYDGSGSTGPFTYTTRIRDEDHLRVTKRSTLDVETVLTITTDYTVTGVGVSSGGSITLVTALATGEHLTIEIIEPLTQTTDIRNQGSFYPETHEDAFDHFIRIDQQQQNDIDLSFKFQSTVDPDDFDTSIPVGVVGLANVVPMTNDDGDGWADADDWPSGASIAAAATNAASAASSAAAAANSAGINSPFGISNLGLSTSVGSNALTIALKQGDGSTDPATTTGAVRIYFRSSTLTTGSLTERTVTSALSVVVPSSATLGHNNALEDYIFVYAIDNAGTVELAVSSSSHWDEGSRVSTTTISASATDAATLYSTTARTNVACRLIGRLLSTQTTAGTWAAAMTEVTVGFLEQRIGFVHTRAAAFTAKHGRQYLVSAASTRNIQLPTPRAGWYTDIKDSTLQSATNAFTLVRAGSEAIETVSASYTLSRNGGSWRITSDGTNWFVTNRDLSVQGEVFVDTGNGSGSTNNKIRRFSNIRKNTGTSLTYADSATNGGSVTVNEAGIYYVSVGDLGDGGDFFGISVNSANLTTSIVSITYADGRRAVEFADDTIGRPAVWTGALAAGDIIRSHHSGSPGDGSASTYLHVTQLVRFA